MNIYPAPGGSSRVVVGTEYHQDAIDVLAHSGHQLKYASLVREPNNPHDSNAIAVTILGKKVGYISARMAEEYAPLIDTHLRSHEVVADILEFTPEEDGGAEIRIDLAWPRDFIDEQTLDFTQKSGQRTASPTPKRPGPARNAKGQFVKQQPAPPRQAPRKQYDYTWVAKFYRVCAYVLLTIGLLGSALNGSILFLGLAALFWWMQKKMPVATPKGDTDAA